MALEGPYFRDSISEVSLASVVLRIRICRTHDTEYRTEAISVPWNIRLTKLQVHTRIPDVRDTLRWSVLSTLPATKKDPHLIFILINSISRNTMGLRIHNCTRQTLSRLGYRKKTHRHLPCSVMNEWVLPFFCI